MKTTKITRQNSLINRRVAKLLRSTGVLHDSLSEEEMMGVLEGNQDFDDYLLDEKRRFFCHFVMSSLCG